MEVVGWIALGIVVFGYLLGAWITFFMSFSADIEENFLGAVVAAAPLTLFKRVLAAIFWPFVLLFWLLAFTFAKW